MFFTLDPNLDLQISKSGAFAIVKPQPRRVKPSSDSGRIIATENGVFVVRLPPKLFLLDGANRGGELDGRRTVFSRF